MDKDKSEFIFPRFPYHGDWSPEKLVFNANLQEFAEKVGIICGLQTSGKITSDEAYHPGQTHLIFRRLNGQRFQPLLSFVTKI